LPGTDGHLDQKIVADGSKEMEESMVEGEHIKDVINSPDGLSVCGVGGIS
jgi:hypothetical protein